MEQTNYEIYLNNDAFNKIRKNKKLTYIVNKNLFNMNWHINDLITIHNLKNEKIYKTNIKNISVVDNLNNYNQKNIYVDNNTNNELDELLAINFKYKISISKIIFLLIFLLFFVISASFFIKLKIEEINTNKIIHNVEKIKKDEIVFAIVEASDRIVLALQNNLVIFKECLNDECQNLYNDNLILNKSLDIAIENIISKQNEIDDINIVKVYYRNYKINEALASNKNVYLKKITDKEENNILKKIKGNKVNELEKQITNYNERLLKIYEDDKDYNKTYSCKIENNRLNCFITDEFWNELNDIYQMNYTKNINIKKIIQQIFTTDPKLKRLFDKFLIPYYTKSVLKGFDKYSITEGITMEGEKRKLGGGCYIDNCYKNVGVSYVTYPKEGGVVMNYLPLNKVNLVNLEYNNNDLVILNELEKNRE